MGSNEKERLNAVPAEGEYSAAELDAVMKKFDRESNVRIWEGTPKLIVHGCLAAFALYCIFDTLFVSGLVQQARLGLFVGLIIMLGFLIFPAKKGEQKVNHIPWYDILFMGLAALAFGYFVLNAKDLVELRMSRYEWYHIAVAVIALLSVFEICRRSVGLPILVVVSIFIIYAVFFYQADQVILLRRFQNLL